MGSLQKVGTGESASLLLFAQIGFQMEGWKHSLHFKIIIHVL